MADDLNGFAQQVGADVKALRYDSGLRDINGLVDDPAIWTYPGTALQNRLHRVASQVDVSLYNLSYTGPPPTSGGTGAITICRLPLGVRPPFSVFTRTFRGNNAVIQTDGQVRIYGPGTTLDYVNWSFLTRNAPPATPPGSAA